ncbi:MAG: hypothetical protein HKL92_01010 [Candidatus Eremiobacteraeota bacterium]|nr:hypothetical protein [Candidatus Eremiobacteraeota bacterium]
MDILYQSPDIRVTEILDADGEAQRQLYFGPSFTHCQGAIKRDKPWYHVHEFTRHLTYAALAVPNELQRVLFLGLGAGVAIHAVRTWFPLAELDIVDQCQELFQVSHRFFYSLDHPMVHLIHADAAEFLNATHEKYDLICCDVWGSLLEAPGFLKTGDFYDRVNALLRSDGTFAINAPAIEHKRIAELLVPRFETTVSLKGNNSFFISTDNVCISATQPPRLKNVLDYNIDVQAIESAAIVLRSHR